MIELSDREAGELRERLRRVGSAQPAEETIAVSANAITSVTFTHRQKVAVIDVLAQWMNEMGGEEIGEGLFKLRDALTADIECEYADSRAAVLTRATSLPSEPINPEGRRSTLPVMNAERRLAGLAWSSFGQVAMTNDGKRRRSRLAKSAHQAESEKHGEPW